jgi:hypothetical protein
MEESLHTLSAHPLPYGGIGHQAQHNNRRLTAKRLRKRPPVLIFATATLFIWWLTSRLSGQEAPTLGSEEKRILTLENAWIQARNRNDVEALGTLLAFELVYIKSDGARIGKTEMLADARSPKIQRDKMVPDSMVAHVYRESAIVTGEYYEERVHDGKPATGHGRFTDAWVFQNGAWVCVFSQSTLILR